MTGSAEDSLSPRWTLRRESLKKRGGGLGEGGLNIDPDRRLADDGKRLDSSESRWELRCH